MGTAMRVDVEEVAVAAVEEVVPAVLASALVTSDSDLLRLHKVAGRRGPGLGDCWWTANGLFESSFAKGLAI